MKKPQIQVTERKAVYASNTITKIIPKTVFYTASGLKFIRLKPFNIMKIYISLCSFGSAHVSHFNNMIIHIINMCTDTKMIGINCAVFYYSIIFICNFVY